MTKLQILQLVVTNPSDVIVVHFPPEYESAFKSLLPLLMSKTNFRCRFPTFTDCHYYLRIGNILASPFGYQTLPYQGYSTVEYTPFTPYIHSRILHA